MGSRSRSSDLRRQRGSVWRLAGRASEALKAQRPSRRTASARASVLGGRLLTLRLRLLREGAPLVDALGEALGQHVEGIGLGLARELHELTRTLDALLERLLGERRLLLEPLLGGADLRPALHQGGGLAHRRASELDLPLGELLEALHRQLIGLGERLEVLALRRHDSLDIEAREGEPGEQLADFRLEEFAVNHRRIPSLRVDEVFAALQHDRNMAQGMPYVKARRRFLLQRNRTTRAGRISH